jgi:hypothetical protein
MKKILLASLLLAFMVVAHAQSRKDSLSASLQGNNEVKLNILYTLLGSPEVTYERILSHHNAVGISAFYRVFEPLRSDFDFGVVPYFRHYFGQKKASGFFLEAHAGAFGYDGGQNAKHDYYVDNYGNAYPVVFEKKTVFGAGAVLGTKFLTRKGFTGDFYLGALKTFDNKVVDFFPRVGLSLGKRF